jgi:hypothetical protein
MACEDLSVDTQKTINRITGRYLVDEWSETLGAQNVYNISISEDNRKSDHIYLENFYNAGLGITAEVNGSKIVIPVQQVEDYEIEGFGSFYENQLTINYSVSTIGSRTGLTDICNSICTKQ